MIILQKMLDTEMKVVAENEGRINKEHKEMLGTEKQRKEKRSRYM